MVKCGETPLEGEGHVKTRETLYVWSMCMMVLWRLLCWIHVGEHSVHARLDYWIWSQNCRNTLLWHECSTSECTKWETVMDRADELSENSNPQLGLAFDSTIWWNKDLCTQSRTENGCLEDCARMRTLGLNLATCYLAAWAEKAVKFELSNEKGREYQTKTRRIYPHIRLPFASEPISNRSPHRH